MAGREDKYTTKALMGEGKLSMPSLPSFKDVSPAQRKMEAREAQDARDNAAEKTLRKYRGVKEGLPAMLADDTGYEGGPPPKGYPRKRGTLGAGPQDFDESKPVTTEGKPYYSDKEVQRYYANDRKEEGKKRGGAIKKYASGGSIRGGGCEQRGKTKGRMV
jgi:hypothetical protein